MDLIHKYFNNLSPTQYEQMSALEVLYKDWNAKINVISRKDIDNFYEHHVLHSLAIAKFINFLPNAKILDIGTGGGFPGVPLAIMFPQTNFILVDSIGKKLKVVDDVAKQIGLSNVTTIHTRAEQLNDKYDFVTSRAVTRLDVAWSWAGPLLSPVSLHSVKNGLIYLKGGDINAEIPNNCIIQKIPLNNMFKEPYFAEKAIVYGHN